MPESDAKLVERCKAGDARAWESVVKTYTGRIMNMAYRYTHNYAVAEELTQDVFVKIYGNLDSYRPDTGSFRNWLLRVGRNLIIDHYRAHKREKHVAGSEELEVLDFTEQRGDPSPYQSLHQKEKAEFLYRSMEQLSFELKEAVLLRDIEGFSYREIANMLSIPEGTVKSRINRGRVELARTLRQARQGEAS